jgi:hypothetical protein
MEIGEFRARVRQTFGEDLHRASPASVRDFLDTLTEESAAPIAGRRFVIDETAKTYEEVMRTFFCRVLELPQDQAVLQLWVVALELSYALIESQDAERLGSLFRGLEEPYRPEFE